VGGTSCVVTGLNVVARGADYLVNGFDRPFGAQDRSSPLG
jgi:hypothetical protein